MPWRASVVLLAGLQIAGVLTGAQARQAPGTGCKADKDCFHTGCSSHLCASRDVPTTCEFICRYGCQAKAACICEHGRCDYKKDDAYRQCLSGCGATGTR